MLLKTLTMFEALSGGYMGAYVQPFRFGHTQYILLTSGS